ncbi:MAG: response regulator transcription factor [Dehalococcoidia bacterium]|nr:response regulator transcription factor [Dehalococcoidia bacterium]
MNAHPLVLAVDDEPGILRLLKSELTAQGFGVITAGNGEEALKLIEERRPDVILLDIAMPGMDGLQVMRSTRERMSVPILLVTAKDRTADRVRGLELGADDYIVKPFSMEELGARIRAVLRRRGGEEPENVVRSHGVEVDLTRRLVKRDGEPVSLSRTEWMLLQHLAANAGKVILNAELLSKVWGPEYRDDLQYLRVWVSRLRQKLEPDRSNPAIIRTLNGIGYIFEPDPVVLDEEETVEAVAAV